jgi:hypothetical protein
MQELSFARLNDVGNRATHDGRSMALMTLEEALKEEDDTPAEQAAQAEVIALLRSCAFSICSSYSWIL